LSAVGGTPPYTWSIFEQPAGLDVQGDTVVGNPTVAGSFSFFVAVTDSATPNNSVDQTVQIVIQPPVVLTTTATTVAPTTTTRKKAPATTAVAPTKTTAAAPTKTTAAAPTAAAPTAAAPTATTAVAPTATTAVAPTTTASAAVPGLNLSRPSIEPGGQIRVTGGGCTPGSDVRISIGDEIVGATVADPVGAFSGPVNVPIDLAVGQYDVVVACGPTLTGALDVVVSTSVDAGTSTLGLFLFFLLLAIALFRRRRLVHRRPRQREVSDGLE
jgi:hypothetical protein